jgi:protein-L-isoaspartate(D-aspartate) O-methyltransferase
MVPSPLLEQLSPGGRLVIPLGGEEQQVLTLIEEHNGEFRKTIITDVRFVPLLGQFGFNPGSTGGA